MDIAVGSELTYEKLYTSAHCERLSQKMTVATTEVKIRCYLRVCSYQTSFTALAFGRGIWCHLGTEY